MELVIGIVFIVFVLFRVFLGKEDGNDNRSGSGHRPCSGDCDDETEKSPPSYY